MHAIIYEPYTTDFIHCIASYIAICSIVLYTNINGQGGMVEDCTWLIQPHCNHEVHIVENITYYDTNNVCNMFAIQACMPCLI